MPAPTKVQLTGGQFQDSEGNKLALGYLLMKLAMDANISGVGNIASGIEIRIQLDSNGSVVASPAQSVWGVDQMLPINNYYRVTGYTAAGQPAWGPNNQQVIGNGGTFDVGTWVPNQVISWTPPLQSLELDVNATKNPNQGRLNFEDTATVSWAVDSNGNLEATASAPAGIELQTNGVDNGDQTKLNLKSGLNMSVTDDGVGGVTIANTQIVPGQANPRANWRAQQAVVATAFPSVNGGYGLVGAGTGLQTGSAATATTPCFASALTSATPGDQARWQSAATPSASEITFGVVRNMEWKFRASDLTNIQVFCGIQKNTSLSSTSATPADTYGFRYSTVSGDTNWQCYVDTAGGRTLVDSGVAVTTAFVKFTMVGDGSTGFTFFINDVQVGHITSNLPAAGDQLYSFIRCDNAVSANIRSADICYIYFDTI